MSVLVSAILSIYNRLLLVTGLIFIVVIVPEGEVISVNFQVVLSFFVMWFGIANLSW